MIERMLAELETPSDALLLQAQMVALVRAFGWHRPEQTPCGQPVPISEAHALMELAREESLAQSELGARLGLEKSTVSRLVGQLEARGWLERRRSSADARVVVLVLTPMGTATADQLAHARATFFARILERVPEERRDDLLGSLTLLVQVVHAQRA